MQAGKNGAVALQGAVHSVSLSMRRLVVSWQGIRVMFVADAGFVAMSVGRGEGKYTTRCLVQLTGVMRCSMRNGIENGVRERYRNQVCRRIDLVLRKKRRVSVHS